MSTETIMEIYLDLARVGHIFSGILWIGILYYFNFIQAVGLPKMEAPARVQFMVNVQPLALQVFRWAALSTVVFGIAYILGIGSDQVGYYASDQFMAIVIGGTLGIIMAANVWMVIWPNQQKVIAAMRATAESGTEAPADQPKWARTALLASRTNVMLSIPMLFFMVAARHLPSLWS
jgi:uncharacterized membrane protein